MDKPSVLLIYTGGTIGMMKDPTTGSLTAFDFGDVHKHIPELERLNVSLTTISFAHPIDSSEMNPKLWAEIAEIVVKNYDAYDGFVILHGSDTMAFTASALSFMLQGLKKPVILTGSQLPIGTIRTDGKENMIAAIEIAAAKDETGAARIQEVAIYFEYSLYRGNRTSKVSASAFEAFQSPNLQPLAVAGVDITYSSSRWISDLKELTVFTGFSDKVALIKLFPGMSWKAYKGLFDPSLVSGIILETYGAGNAASDKVFQELVRNYIQQGGVVINITQCATGTVEQGKYEASSFFATAGVVAGADLTAEGAITKLMYAVGKYPSDAEKVKMLFRRSICGEQAV